MIQFCQSKIAGLATASRSGASAGGGNSTLAGSAAWMTGDKDSYVLLWELLILLLRQKNTIDGSDIAELLLKDRKDVHRPYRAQVLFRRFFAKNVSFNSIAAKSSTQTYPISFKSMCYFLLFDTFCVLTRYWSIFK